MLAYLVVGLVLGDEGKGTCCERLTRTHNAKWNIRFNGGAQAAHNVVRPDGTHHRFQQFGSGTFEGAATFLSKDVIIHPLRLLAEAQSLQDKGIPFPLFNHSTDNRALVITPYHIALNQLRERSRGDTRHGSTGLGIGETRLFSIKHPDAALRARDLQANPWLLQERMRFIAETVVEEAREYDSSAKIDEQGFKLNVAAYKSAGNLLQIVPDDYFPSKVATDGNLIFEGAQGVLLDELYGFAPYNTWSNTTSGNALAMLKEASYSGEIKTIGVMRPYMTRHGAGPLPTEDPGLSTILSDVHNTGDEWTGPMRYGYLDCVLLRYAIQVNGGMDEIALTHVDEVSKVPDKVAGSYNYNGREILNVAPDLTIDGPQTTTERLSQCTPLYMQYIHGWLDEIFSTFAGIPITLTSHGPTINDKIEHPALVST